MSTLQGFHFHSAGCSNRRTAAVAVTVAVTAGAVAVAVTAIAVSAVTSIANRFRRGTSPTVPRSMRPSAAFAVALALVTLAPTAPSAGAHPGASTAQSTAPPQPSEGITLALGGGGARGFAHIGALLWLDEHRVPVDAVVGTSIGGLVGGVFAAGLDADELERTIATADWERLLDWSPPHAARSMRDKLQARTLPGAVTTGLIGGLPLGVDPAHALGLLFSRLTLPVSDVADFDALPTPYRAVTVDIVSGERVVLDDGPLPRAMLATMALPGFFRPRRVGDALLIDGGQLSTVPADVARSLERGPVVAIDVSPALDPIEEIEGLADVYIQSLTAVVRANIERALDGSEVYVRPALGDVEPRDYHRFDDLVARGYEAMECKAETLRPFSVSDDEYAAWKHRRARIRGTPGDWTIDSLAIEADDPRSRSEIRDELRGLVGRPLDVEALERRLDELRARDRFQSFLYERTRSNGLRVLATESGRRTALVAGLVVRATELEDVDLGVHVRWTLRDWLRRDAEVQADLLVGPSFGAAAEVYLPVAGALFVGQRVGYDQRTRSIFDDGDRVAEFRRRSSTIGFDLGLGHHWLSHELRAGLIAEHTARDERRAATDPPTTRALRARLQWAFDTTDRATDPHRGVRGRVALHRSLARDDEPDDLTQAHGRIAAWWPIGRHAVVARTAGGTTFDRDAPLFERFALGGPLRLGTLRPDERLGSNFEYAAVGWQHRLDDPFGPNRFHLLVLFETGAVHARDDEPVFDEAGSVNLLVDTPLGNLTAGVAAGGDDARGYLLFGVIPW